MKNDLPPRERLLETAYKLFYTQGYNATGINQILEDAQVAKASLYQHFKSKEELGIEYIKKVKAEWFLAFDRYIEKRPTTQEKILAAFDFLEVNMKLNEFRGCRFLNLLSDVDTTSRVMHDLIIEHKNNLRIHFRKLVENLTAENRELSENTSDTIYLLFEAAVIECKVYKESWPITAAKNAVSSILKL